MEIHEFFTIFNNVLRFSFFIQEFSWKVLNNLNLILYFIYVSSCKFTKVHEQKNTILDFFTWNFWRIVHEFTWIILSWIFGYKARIFFVSNLFFLYTNGCIILSPFQVEKVPEHTCKLSGVSPVIQGNSRKKYMDFDEIVAGFFYTGIFLQFESSEFNCDVAKSSGHSKILVSGSALF